MSNSIDNTLDAATDQPGADAVQAPLTPLAAALAASSAPLAEYRGLRTPGRFSSTPEELAAGEQILWRAYDTVDCPVLIVRGEQSDLLTRATVDEMLQRNPRAQAHEVRGVGHAPTLIADEQVEPVAAFLLA